MRRLLLWLSHDPHSTSHGGEAARVGAMASAFDIEVRFVFIGDGVRAVIAGPEPYRLGPPIEKLFGSHLTTDHPGLVDRASLRSRGIDADSLTQSVPLEIAGPDAIAAAVRAADWVVPL